MILNSNPKTPWDKYYFLREKIDEVPDPDNYTYGIFDSAFAEAIENAYAEYCETVSEQND